ncbi:hypothetical protein GCM10027591_06340 [Zhihengliuella somnathii]
MVEAFGRVGVDHQMAFTEGTPGPFLNGPALIGDDPIHGGPTSIDGGLFWSGPAEVTDGGSAGGGRVGGGRQAGGGRRDDDVVQFDVASAAQMEAIVLRIAGRIEQIVGDREQQAKFVADNWEDAQNREGYDAKEKAWISAGENTLALVRRVRQLLEQNQITAGAAGHRVRNIVDSI